MGANFYDFRGATWFFSNKQTRVEIDDVIWRSYVNTNKYPCFFASSFFSSCQVFMWGMDINRKECGIYERYTKITT